MLFLDGLNQRSGILRRLTIRRSQQVAAIADCYFNLCRCGHREVRAEVMIICLSFV